MDATRTHLFEGASASELSPIFSDVESYPSFVPGVKSAEIVQRNEREYRTKFVMAIGVGLFSFEEELHSVTTQPRPFCIEVCSTGSRFIKSLNNTWRLRDVAGGCEVMFEMSIEFAALPAIVQPAFARLAQAHAETIMQAFVARAEAQRRAAVADRSLPPCRA